MNQSTGSLPASYFEALYASNPDPWAFRTSEYEAAKYAHTLSALPKPRYGSGLEVGCSIGVLTKMLAERCDTLLALDASARAVGEARKHCGSMPGLSLEVREVPRQWPRGRYDLLLLSEVVYYWDEADLARVAELARRDVAPGGDVLLVHWIGTTDYPLSGDVAVEGFITATADIMRVERQERTERYRLDLLRRN
jgi:SAM-dependent methyltransferase